MSGNKKYDDVLSLYNDTCLELSKVIKLSAKRKKQIDKMFCLGYSLEDFKKVFESTQKSSFLCGKANDKSNWRANFDWLIKEDNFFNSRVINDIEEFKSVSDVIVVNRVNEELKDVKEKIYTRDLYKRD